MSARGYWIANLIAVEARPEVIAEIAARPEVAWVEPAFRARLIEPVERPAAASKAAARAPSGQWFAPPPGIVAIRAPEVWSRLGLTGSGRLVANVDTGVDVDHPALRDRWRGARLDVDPRAAWFDPADTSGRVPFDPNSHGTHVLGTITGRGPSPADTIGVAWGAEWIASNAIQADSMPGGGDPIIAAFEWLADPDGNPETVEDVPDVVQNSWGIGRDEPGYEPCLSQWWSVVDNCEAAGVVVTWSAGNDGPGNGTIIVPADRAATATRNFSIGAVRASGASFPYQVAPFSSRGPSLCTQEQPLILKPEVVAPGVDVYSCVPGGGYQGGWSGTSMAGPHVAGIVALLREANPDLDPDQIKTILMETARDLGRPGEDNESGWGFVDAYAAVLRALNDYGRIEGLVRNGSVGGTPVPGAAVVLPESGGRFAGTQDGRYAGAAPEGEWMAVAQADGFAPESSRVTVVPRQVARLDFLLRDVAGPSIRPLLTPESTVDTAGPHLLRFWLHDPSGIDSVFVRYRIEGEDWRRAAAGLRDDLPAGKERAAQARAAEPVMAASVNPDGAYEAGIPGAPAGTRIEWYAQAWDGAGLASVWPSGGAADPAVLHVRRRIASFDFEPPGAAEWTAGAPGDDATAGFWVAADPNGTSENGVARQPESDHSPDGGTNCFVTGNAEPGSSAGANDVDGGCTTLLSPVFDLEREREVFVSWWYWLGKGGASTDDTLAVDISADGGSTWRRFARHAGADTVWQPAVHRIRDEAALTSQVRFRFVACDRGFPGVMEAGLDDFALEAQQPPRPLPPPPPSIARLLPVAPNPSRGECRIRFELPVSGAVRITVFDVLGRRVRVLRETTMPAGRHVVAWDGRNAAGLAAPSGLYFCRLEGPGISARRPFLMLK